MSPIAPPSRHLPAPVRRLLHTPGFTLVALFTLALGIGANVALFSVVDGILIRPLPFPDAGRLLAVDHTAPGIDIVEAGTSDTLYVTYRDQAKTLAAVGAFDDEVFNLTGLDRPERVEGARVTASLGEILGAVPAAGRGLVEDDERPGAEPVAVLSHALWRERFGGDPAAVGRTVQLDGVATRIVGVLPEGLAYPSADTRVWLPLTIDLAELEDGDFNWGLVGRMAPGATIDDVRRELSALVLRSLELHPGVLTAEMVAQAQLAPVVASLRDDVVGEVSRTLWVLLGAVGLILLIACANVANLFLVRAEGRTREVAVRAALGAGRGDLARLFLGESLALALAGGAVGLGLAAAGVEALVAWGPAELPRLAELGVDLRAVAFTLVVSLFAAALFGSAPLARLAKAAGAGLAGGRGATAGRERHRLRHALVAAQVALALVLLAGSGLLLRTFWNLSHLDPGFDPDGVLTLRVSVDDASYPDADRVAAFYQRVLDRLAALPGVTAVGAGSGLPLEDANSTSAMLIEGRPVPAGGVPPVLDNARVAPGYFETLRIPLVEGRTFERADHEEHRKVVVVSRALAEQFWPGGSALGKRLQTGLPTDDDLGRTWSTVVGVVGDPRRRDLAAEPGPIVFFPMGPPAREDRGWYARTMTLAVRTAGEPLALAEAARQAVWAEDANLPVAAVRPLSALVDRALARTSFAMVLLALAAAVALALGAVGLYGVISHVVSLRTREIGVRMALGAASGTVARMVLGQGLKVAAAGVALGLAGAVLATHALAALLHGVAPGDPATLAATAALLLAVAAAASWLPARRAAAVAPTEALRQV